MKLAKIVLSLLVFVLAVVSVNAQTAVAEVYDFKLVEKLPAFPGGPTAMEEFISKSIVYPDECRRNKTQGVIKVEFIVTTEGKVISPKILSNPEIDNRLIREAYRVVESMPAWSPAEVKGNKVACKMQTNVTFKL